MQLALRSIQRVLNDRRTFILVFAAITIAVIGCRGSGSDPSSGDQELPVISATASQSQCVNHVQPEGAPTFAGLDFSRLQVQDPGLRFYDIEQGTGDTPNLFDAVSVEYTGWLENGCMFDTSYPNEGAVNFPLLNVIGGWQQSFATMQEGGTRVIEIQPDLAYGAIGLPPRIPSDATLIFHVTLINRVTIEEAQATVQAEIADATAVAAENIAANETAVASGTVFPSTCRNGDQPDDAPAFDDIDFDRFETLIEGVRFYDIVAGDGESPASTDVISVEYTGWLESGCIFDTSFTDDGSISFPLRNLIQGWQEGIGTMNVGGTRIIEIAPALAYGESGSTSVIPPNATIIFYVELLDKIPVQ